MIYTAQYLHDTYNHSLSIKQGTVKCLHNKTKL